VTLPDREPDLTPVDPGRPEILRRVFLVEQRVANSDTNDAPRDIFRIIGAVLGAADDILEPVARQLLDALAERALEKLREGVGVDL
jgi:hypothetical protein